MSIEVTDEMIQQLTQAWVSTIPMQYPEEELPRHFSLRFHLRMLPVLFKARRRERALAASLHPGRGALALLAAALMTATVAMAVPAIRERVFQLVRDVYDQYSHFHYEQVGEFDEESEAFSPYHLTYVPEGFVLVEERTTDISHEEQYVNADGMIILMKQIKIEDAEFSLDTELEEPEEILLANERPAWYLDSESLRIIYWNDDEYSFRVFGYLPKEELMKIANFVSA